MQCLWRVRCKVLLFFRSESCTYWFFFLFFFLELLSALTVHFLQHTHDKHESTQVGQCGGKHITWTSSIIKAVFTKFFKPSWIQIFSLCFIWWQNRKATHRWPVSSLLTSSQLETCYIIMAVIKETDITLAKAQVFVPEF